MNQPDHSQGGRVVGLQERRLGRTVLRTYRAKVDLDDVVPNERQPRMGAKPLAPFGFGDDGRRTTHVAPKR